MKPDKNLIDNQCNSSNEDSSSSSEEDENAELLTEELEDGFFRVLSHLKKEGSERYEESVTFFQANSTEVESPEKERVSEKDLKDRQKEYKKWLKGKVEKVEDKEVKKELKALHDFWTSPTLNESEQFLRDYILNKKFLDPDKNFNIEEEIKKLSDEEKEIEEELDFEYKYNCRFENSDKELTTKNKSKSKNKKDKHNKQNASQERNKTLDTEVSQSRIKKDKKNKHDAGQKSNETIDNETSQSKVKKNKHDAVQESNETIDNKMLQSKVKKIKHDADQESNETIDNKMSLSKVKKNKNDAEQESNEALDNEKYQSKIKKGKKNKHHTVQESNKILGYETSQSKVKKDKENNNGTGQERSLILEHETYQSKVKKDKENETQGSSKHPNETTSLESANLEIKDNKSVVVKKSRKRKRKRKTSPAKKIFNETKKTNEEGPNLGKQEGVTKCKDENNFMDMGDEENLQSNMNTKEIVQSGSLQENPKKKHKKLDTNVRSFEDDKNTNLPRNRKMKNLLGKRRYRSRKMQTQNKDSSSLDHVNVKGSGHQESKKEQLVNTNITSKENKVLKVRHKKRRRRRHSTSSSGFKTFVGDTAVLTTKKDKQFQNLIVKEKINKQNKLSKIQKNKQKAEKAGKR